MLREYVERFYVPTTARLRDRRVNAARLSRELVAWHRALEQWWSIGIIEGHEGAIRVKSAPGGGTLFVVELPIAVRL